MNLDFVGMYGNVNLPKHSKLNRKESNMTKSQINNILRSTAKLHGFATTEEAGFQGFSEIQSEELNFNYMVQTTENTDWQKGIVEQTLTVTASVRKMGGQPSAAELFRTAKEIEQGTLLIRELEEMDLTWTETF